MRARPIAFPAPPTSASRLSSSAAAQRAELGWSDAFALRDLSRVGPAKPLGSMPLMLVADLVGRASQQARQRGQAFWVLPSAKASVDAVYVFDRAALRSLLHPNRWTLRSAGVPVDPDGFVRHLHHHRVGAEKYPAAHRIVELAYGYRC